MSDSNSGQFPDPWAAAQSNQDGTPAPDQAFPSPPPVPSPDPVPQPPAQPDAYGQPATPGAPGYGQPATPGAYVPPPPPGYTPTPAGYGPPPGLGVPQAYGQPGYPQPAMYSAPPSNPTPASTIVLLVLSAFLTISCYFSLAGLPPLVLSIVALTKNSTDPAQCKKLTKIGWIVFAILVLLVIAGFAALLIVASSNRTY